jgi:UDP-N-acetylmuramoyl-tripeptide--D-alanyl-D-alanine ligase
MTFLWTDLEVRKALGLNPQRALSDLVFDRIWTDSRTVERGDLFLALPGERFDGHDFVADALARGAAGVVVSREVAADEGARIYPVRDTLSALGRMALHRRKALNARVVAVTGSSGKTTTKDLLEGVLAGSFRVHATPRNLNNRIGLPQTILMAPDDAQLLVLEMGTNEPGEIRALTEVAEPELGVITTVGETHLEKLGSVEGVLEEKLDLFRGIGVEGVGVVGDEPAILADRARPLVGELRVAGWTHQADPEFRPVEAEITEKGCFRFRWMGEKVRLRIPGRHSVQNALLALAVAHSLGIPARDAARRIQKVEARGMRSEIRVLGGLTLLLDCYNANPQSVRAALDLLETVQVLGPRVAVLGSMLELGARARILHRQALEDALARSVDLIVATGLFAEAAQWVAPAPGAPELVAVSGMKGAEELLLQRLGGTEVVLLKASRGVEMETLLPALEGRFGPPAAASSENPGSLPSVPSGPTALGVTGRREV